MKFVCIRVRLWIRWACGVSHCAFEAMDARLRPEAFGERAVGEDGEEAVEDRVPLFRIELLGQLQDSFTSANNIVTCLRSPLRPGSGQASRADFDCRILSARCLGV